MEVAEIESLYRRHGHAVLRRARRLLRSEDEAREVLHDVFASLLDRPDQLRGASAVTTWLYGATTHACLNRLRNERTRARLLTERGAPDEAAPHDAERAAILHELLRLLPDELAQVAVYYYADEMTHEEISLVLGCSRRHVGNLVDRLGEHVRNVEGVA